VASAEQLERRLRGVNAELAHYVREAAEVVAHAAPPGVLLRVVSGRRTAARQAMLRRQWESGDRGGLSSQPAARSAHVDGLAVDLGFSYNGRAYPVRDTPREYWQFLADLLEPVGVTWGGRWRRPSWNHFEIRRPDPEGE